MQRILIRTLPAARAHCSGCNMRARKWSATRSICASRLAALRCTIVVRIMHAPEWDVVEMTAVA